jgi:hypothetical protein
MLAIWAAFIAWGTFFHCGGQESGLSSAILGNVAGAVIAGITLWVVTQTGIGAQLGLPIWAGICVGIGVAAMVLLANIPAFAAIPAQVYGFACPFRKFHPAWIRIVRQNHRILESNDCDPARARNVGRGPVQVTEPA